MKTESDHQDLDLEELSKHLTYLLENDPTTMEDLGLAKFYQ